MLIEAQAFKNTLSRWASGVTVVTTTKNGEWKGTTVSSFSSVSLDPPLVLICIANKLVTHDLLVDTGLFAANILNEEQTELGKLFAGMMPEVEDRFTYGKWGWDTAVTGAPVLPSASGWVDCKIVHTYDGGDHTIFVGEVQAASASDAPPLLYYNRHWGHFKAT
jgi:flavin reductase (DIM6/NTAB) family NADH-FMN oxidoreductase RutF